MSSNKLADKKIIAVLLIAIIVAPMLTYFVTVEQIGGAVKEREMTIKELEGQIDELKSNMQGLEEQVTKLRSEVQGLGQDKEKLLADLQDRELRIAALEEAITSLNSTIQQLELDKENLLAGLQERDARIEELENLLETFNVTTYEREALIQQLERQIETLRSELAELMQFIEAPPENTTIVNVYPWITKTVEVKNLTVTVKFFVENNVGHDITSFSFEYTVMEPDGRISFFSISADPELFGTNHTETLNTITYYFILKNGSALKVGEFTELIASYVMEPEAVVSEETVITPEPYSTADTDYDQVNDLLEEMIAEAARVGNATEIIVSLERPVTPEDLELFEEYGGTVISELPIINGFHGLIPAINFFKYIEEIRDILHFVDPNLPVQLELSVSVPNIRANVSWNADRPFRFRGDPKTSIAFTDTGIDDSHPGFGGYQNVATVGWDAINPNTKIVGFANFTTMPPSTANPVDRDGHGSHVAGIAAGSGGGNPANRYIGVARDSKIVMLHNRNIAQTIAAINWAINNSRTYNIIAISMSQGFGLDHVINLERAVNRAIDGGIVFIKSAGNWWHLGLGITTPGNIGKIITVGAVNKTDYVTSFSANGLWLDVVAPGRDILSVDSNDRNRVAGQNNYVSLSGTSMAAPHVAGEVALLIDAVTDYDAVDEDKDGRTDEDPWDGVDNDGDGLIDEDLGKWIYERKFGTIDGEVIDDLNGNGRYDAGDRIVYEGERPGIQSFSFNSLALRLKGIILMTAFEVQKGERADRRYRWVDVNGNGRVDGNDQFFFDRNDDGHVTFSDNDGDGTFDSFDGFRGPNRPVQRRAIRPGGWVEFWLDFDNDGNRDANEPSTNETATPEVMVNDPAFPRTPNAGKENKPILNKGFTGGWDSKEGYGRISVEGALDAVTKVLCAKAEDTLGPNPSDKKVWAARVYMYKDAQYKLKLKVPTGADYDLYMYEYNPSFFGLPVIFKSSTYRTGNEYIDSFSPPRDGIYYVVVKWVSGGGNFTLEMETKKKYTLMFYVAADREGLDELAFEDLNEIERAGPDGNVNIIVQVDWGERNQSHVQRFVATWLKDDRPNNRWKEHLISLHNTWSYPFTLCMDEEELSTGNQETLVDFLNFTVRYFPANEYVLVLWGDGDGWKVNENFDEGKGAGLLSDSKKNPDALTMKELRQALQKYINLKQGIGDLGSEWDSAVPKLGIIMFDSPLMATIEVAREVSDYAQYMVASQGAWIKNGFEPPTKRMDAGKGGWNYTKLIEHLKDNLKERPLYSSRLYAWDIPSLGKDPVHTASSIDLWNLKGLIQLVNAMGQQLAAGTRDYQKHIDSSDNVAERLRIIRLSVQTFGGITTMPVLKYGYDFDPGTDAQLKPLRFGKNDPVWGDMDYIDLYHFADLVVKDPIIPERYKGAARSVLANFYNVIMTEYHSSEFPNAHGLSIYFPYQQTRHTERTDSINEYDFDSPMRLSQYHYTTITFPGDAPGWVQFLHQYWTPVADIGFDYIVVGVGELVQFNGLGSSDTDASREFVDNRFVPRYYWIFGDGETAESYWYDTNNNGARDELEYATDAIYDGMTMHAYGRPGVYYPVLHVNDEDKKSSTDDAIVVVIPAGIPTYPDDPLTPPTDTVPTDEAAWLIADILRFELTKSAEFIPAESLDMLIGMTDEIYSSIREGSYQRAKDLALQAMDLVNSVVEDEDLRDALAGSYEQITTYLDIPGQAGQLTVYGVVQITTEDGLTTIVITIKFHYYYESETLIIETTITFINTIRIYMA